MEYDLQVIKLQSEILTGVLNERDKKRDMKDTVLVLGDLFNVLPDAIVVVDGTGMIVFANAAVSGLLGYSADELIGQSLNCLVPENYRKAHESHFVKFFDRGKPTSMGARPLLSALHKSAKEIPISISIANLDLEAARYSVAVMRDSGELHSRITQATALAETDVLTGLGNRLCLSRAIHAALVVSSPFGLLFLDLRKFKPFNDNHGHGVGDKVLQIVAKRLQALVRRADLAARLGGDEFVLMFDGLVDIELLQQRAAAVATSVARPFRIGGLSSSVEVNIGGAMFPRDGSSEAELLKVADQHMYRAKKTDVAFYIGEAD
jgi:diguanylate cyclase (GGDEF)-like protein/PAS domain S-box-containing protein